MQLRAGRPSFIVGLIVNRLNTHPHSNWRLIRTVAMVQPLDFLYPSSFFITTMSLVGFLSISFFGVLEILGIHLQYSKLWNANSRRIKVSSTAGMLLLYAPACLFGFASFWIFPENGFRSLLVASALTIHFFKRVLEVCTSLLYALIS